MSEFQRHFLGFTVTSLLVTSVLISVWIIRELLTPVMCP